MPRRTRDGDPELIGLLRAYHPNAELSYMRGGRRQGPPYRAHSIVWEWDHVAAERDRHKADAKKWYDLAMSTLDKLEAAHAEIARLKGESGTTR